MAEQQSFLSSWQERLTALRNTPPVLKIVWKSGPGVVVFGLVSRLFASLLPLALLWIPKLIVDEITHPKFAAHVMSPRLWWLVASEFGLAVLGGILARAIDYSDSLLADKYTRYVSIQVMPFLRSASRRFRNRPEREAGCSVCWRLPKKDCWRATWKR